MKKLILCLFSFAVTFPAWASSVLENSSHEVLRAGGQEVERLKNSAGKDFFLSNIIAPKQKKTVKVVAYINLSLNNAAGADASYLQENPGYAYAIEALFPYVEQGWQDWREAANAWLPKNYQLPNLKFTLVDGYQNDKARKARWNDSTVNLSLETTTGKYGFYQGNNAASARGIGMPYFTQDGNGFGRIRFFVEQEWMDYFNAMAKSPEEQAKAAEEYKKAVSAQMAGEFYESATNGKGYNWDSKLTDNSKKYMNALSKSEPGSWHKQGPWAAYNQHIMTHELGHLFGLVHIDEPNSMMTSTVDGNSVARPSSNDGLRLATLVCWYHNQRAKKEVCVPVSTRAETQEVKEALKKSMKRLEQNQVQLAGLASKPQAPKKAPVIKTEKPAGVEKSGSANIGRQQSMLPVRMNDGLSPNAVVKLPEDTTVSGNLGRQKSMLPERAANKQAPELAAQPAPVAKQPTSLAVAPEQAPLLANVPLSSLQQNPPAASQPAAPKKKVCFVCGKEMEEGEYYSFTESRHVHKNSKCAYRAFAHYHGTDSKNLARYEDFYFFRTPKDVVQAKADMRSLGLTVNDIRSYAAQDAAEQQKQLEQAKAEKAAAQARAQQRAQQDQKCRFYVHVGTAELQQFTSTNRLALQEIRQKQLSGRKLSKNEERLKTQYDQLYANYRLTRYCQGLD